jgi:hypothetical protein
VALMRRRLKAWHADLHRRIAAVVSTDAALAQQSIADLKAGVRDETPAYDAANDASLDAIEALSWPFTWYADWLSGVVNREVWEHVWELEDQHAA